MFLLSVPGPIFQTKKKQITALATMLYCFMRFDTELITIVEAVLAAIASHDHIDLQATVWQHVKILKFFFCISYNNGYLVPVFQSGQLQTYLEETIEKKDKDYLSLQRIWECCLNKIIQSLRKQKIKKSLQNSVMCDVQPNTLLLFLDSRLVHASQHLYSLLHFFDKTTRGYIRAI